MTSDAAATDLDARNLALDHAHVFQSWAAQNAHHPISLAGGEGCRVWDYSGRSYLDFSSQLVNTNIGHQHPRVVAAIKAQADQLTTMAPAHASLARGEAALRISQVAPDGFNRVFFTNAGAEAVENAIRMARVFTGRPKVLSAYRSYHGNTGAAINATGDWRRNHNEFAHSHVHFFGPFAYRSEFWSESEQQEGERALQHLRRVIESEGPASIAAVLLETIGGTAGVLVPPPGYLNGVRERCDAHGIVMILDEVMAGFGRTGEWLALDGFDVVPDLITFAKGSNSGYVPAGGVIISDPIADSFGERVYPGGLTYSGHPLAMASIVATIDAMREERIVENAARIGAEVIGPALAELAERHAVIGEVRGRGVFWALDLVSDRDSRTPLPAAQMGALKRAMLERGLLPFIAENRIHVVPPCIVSAAEVAEAVAIYDEVLAGVSG